MCMLDLTSNKSYNYILFFFNSYAVELEELKGNEIWLT